jgi:hypothetical protein
MAESELALALDWAAAEGWNPGLSDAHSFYAADPKGFFLGELDGAPIGCVSAIAYDQEYGFLGFYIVRPPYRGRGFGMQLWDAAMAYRPGAMWASTASSPNKKTTGNQALRSPIATSAIKARAATPGLIDLSSVAFDEIARYDRTVFPADRADFLHRWIRQPQGAALAVRSKQRLEGYGVLRACRRGFKIGPLFADDPQIADALFQGLAARAAGQPIFLDAPAANPAAIGLAKRHGMAPVFETARMYTKEPPTVRLDRCFGVTTFELG